MKMKSSCQKRITKTKKKGRKQKKKKIRKDHYTLLRTLPAKYEQEVE